MIKLPCVPRDLPFGEEWQAELDYFYELDLLSAQNVAAPRANPATTYVMP